MFEIISAEEARAKIKEIIDNYFSKKLQIIQNKILKAANEGKYSVSIPITEFDFSSYEEYTEFNEKIEPIFIKLGYKIDMSMNCYIICWNTNEEELDNTINTYCIVPAFEIKNKADEIIEFNKNLNEWLEKINNDINETILSTKFESSINIFEISINIKDCKEKIRKRLSEILIEKGFNVSFKNDETNNEDYIIISLKI